MKRTMAVLIVLAASLGIACADKAAQEKNAALQQRIAELEKQASPSPVALETTLPAEQDLKTPAAGAVQAAEPARPVSKPTTTRREPARTVPAPTPRPGAETREARAPQEEVRAEPAPRWEPAPRPEPITLPEGTELSLVLETPLSSLTSQEGDAVVARVEKAVTDDGRIALPGGTVLKGKVVEAVPSGRVKGRARVTVSFDSITVRGRTHELQATAITAEAADERGRDAKMVGGGAAAGTIIGAITGGKKGAAKGAVIGGMVGGGAVLATKGGEIEMPAGSRWKVRLRDSVRL